MKYYSTFSINTKGHSDKHKEKKEKKEKKKKKKKKVFAFIQGIIGGIVSSYIYSLLSKTKSSIRIKPAKSLITKYIVISIIVVSTTFVLIITSIEEKKKTIYLSGITCSSTGLNQRYARQADSLIFQFSFTEKCSLSKDSEIEFVIGDGIDSVSERLSLVKDSENHSSNIHFFKWKVPKKLNCHGNVKITTLKLITTDQNIIQLVLEPPITPGPSIIIDNSYPMIERIRMISSNRNPHVANTGDTVSFEIDLLVPDGCNGGQLYVGCGNLKTVDTINVNHIDLGYKGLSKTHYGTKLIVSDSLKGQLIITAISFQDLAGNVIEAKEHLRYGSNGIYANLFESEDNFEWLNHSLYQELYTRPINEYAPIAYEIQPLTEDTVSNKFLYEIYSSHDGKIHYGGNCGGGELRFAKRGINIVKFSTKYSCPKIVIQIVTENDIGSNVFRLSKIDKSL